MNKKITKLLNTKMKGAKAVLFKFFFFAIAGNLLLMQPLMATDKTEGNLVDVKWLAENLKNPNILIIDASPAQMYSAQHISGAINVDYFTNRLNEMALTDAEKLYQSWGLSADKKIVIYDEGGTMFATRLFFTLYYHGFPANNLLILNGGLSKWKEEGLQVTKDIPSKLKKGSFSIKKPIKEAIADRSEFLVATGDLTNNVLLEALEPDWHFGEVLAFGRAGHIPNAIMMPRNDFYNADKTFKSAKEIQNMLDYMGISNKQKVYTHCGGGVAATVPFFALKFLVNYPEVKLYEESQYGWLSDERELPYWTYDAPFLMRETNWLKSWSSMMLRMYRGANISIVDIRSADEFSDGHVPFALNIEADLFRSNITSHEKLPAIFGPAGIDVSQEAIIISGAGITKEAALAFVLLEKLGQKKVSIFMDSMDKWVESDSKLTKDATVVAPKKHAHDVTIPPTKYPVNFREGILIKDSKSTHGLYPKIFIASGAKKSSKAIDGEVIHVPYTELLNNDGSPKAAKDVWNILSKAGVPRYAELICYADDIGEAAVNYFILKLMGFPDIKVLAAK